MDKYFPDTTSQLCTRDSTLCRANLAMMQLGQGRSACRWVTVERLAEAHVTYVMYVSHAMIIGRTYYNNTLPKEANEPIVEVDHLKSNKIHGDSVDSLSLSIRLRMEGGTEVQLDARQPEKLCPKVAGGDRISIALDGDWKPMESQFRQRKHEPLNWP